MPTKNDSAAPCRLELSLDLALQTHRALFATLHAEVRQAKLDCDKARRALARRRGPARGGAHYLIPTSSAPARPVRERDTTLPMHRLVI